MMNRTEAVDGVLDLRSTGETSIEDKAYLSEKAIRKVIVPASVVHIGNYAFANCKNLRSVEFLGPFVPEMFGKEVFKGCDELVSISFSDTDPDTRVLLALCTNALAYDHLVRSSDIGQKSWYEKWDISLLSRLKSDFAEAGINAVLCGEEDISYDGIGSVDGEMSAEPYDLVVREEYKRCRLCYKRLVNDRYLESGTKEKICSHIMENRLGEKDGSSFYCIFESGEDVLTYLKLYIDIVKPDRQMKKEMIEACSTADVRAAAFLINETKDDGDIIGKLML